MIFIFNIIIAFAVSIAVSSYAYNRGRKQGEKMGYTKGIYEKVRTRVRTLAEGMTDPALSIMTLHAIHEAKDMAELETYYFSLFDKKVDLEKEISRDSELEKSPHVQTFLKDIKLALQIITAEKDFRISKERGKAECGG